MTYFMKIYRLVLRWLFYIINVYKNSFQNRVNTDKSCLIEHNKMLTLEKEVAYFVILWKSCSVSTSLVAYFIRSKDTWITLIDYEMNISHISQWWKWCSLHFPIISFLHLYLFSTLHFISLNVANIYRNSLLRFNIRIYCWQYLLVRLANTFQQWY